MKNRSMTIAAFLCAFCLSVCHAYTDYVEGGLGWAGGNKSIGPAVTLRGGRRVPSLSGLGMWDFSFGYLNLYGQKPTGLASNHAALPTINIELCHILPVTNKSEMLAVGGGLGYTMPNLASGISERADNDISFTAIGSFTKRLGKRYALNISVRGFFFNTDTHLTTHNSHFENLMVGGAPTGTLVEVSEEFHQDNSVNFNAVLFMISMRWE